MKNNESLLVMGKVMVYFYYFKVAITVVTEKSKYKPVIKN